jgi:dipeptidyl aminopeptidase/acylaminoacyl peptidase
VYDIDRPTGTKITSNGSNRNPLWSADGDWIYYASDAKGSLDVWKRRADLTGHAELVYGADGNQLPVGLTRSGTLILSTFDQSGSTISEIDPSRPDAVKMLVERLFDASEAAVTADGRLLAYQTLSGSTWQIRLLDLASGRQRAVADGYGPKWSPDGSTLLVQSDRVQNVWRLSLLTIATEPQLSVGASVEFDVPPVEPGCCDLASRTRILVLKPVNSVMATTVVVNWPELVRQRR